MKVFVTGATGHIGSAVVPELLQAGHRVVGLARSETSAAALRKAGADVFTGDLADVEGLARTAAACDGVIHLAYRHDLAFSADPQGFAEAAKIDFLAVQAMGTALMGTSKPFVGTSGTAVLGLHARAGVATENDVVASGPRIDTENWVIDLSSRGVRSAVVRLAPSVHGPLDRHGFVPMLVNLARNRGFAAYVDEGANVWNAVHTSDTARLYRLVLEGAPGGKRWHAAAEERVAFQAIASAIGKGLNLPTRRLTSDDASQYFGGFLRFAQLDCPASSRYTQETLNWRPEHETLLEDLGLAHYFRT